MGTPSQPRRRALASDLLALPDEFRGEIVDGQIVEKAAPSGEHAESQAALTAILWGPFRRRPGGPGGPGGWWFGTEVDIELEAHEVYRPDVAGWRRDRVPTRPLGRPVRVRPDWICEVLSPSTAGRDQVTKLRTYHRSGVAHYWILDPDHQTLMAYRHAPEGYLLVLTAQRGERVRAEPFDAIEIPVGALFGDDPDEPGAP